MHFPVAVVQSVKAPGGSAPYNHLSTIDIPASGGHYRRMNEPVIVCGRVFRPELVQHLSQMATQQPPPGRNVLAHEVCTHLAWFSPNGRPALSGAKVALRKLSRRGLLSLPLRRGRYTRTHRLQPSGQPLPPVFKVPKRVDQVQGLHLHLITILHAVEIIT